MGLEIVAVEAFEVCSPFRMAFRHAAAARDEARHLIVRVTTAGGQAGYGEIAPRAYLTGESVESCAQDVRMRWEPALKGMTLSAAEPPFAALRPLYEAAQQGRVVASYSGVDVAVFDAWARATGRPAARMFGDKAPAARPLSAVIGLGVPAGLTARAFLAAGCRDFKVKVGDAAGLARVAAVRRVIGAGRSLRVDANGAWAYDEAVAQAKALAALGVACIEEPLAAKDPEGLARLQRDGGVAVMADESLCTEADARALLAAGAARYWNVRLAKVGGFSGARALFAMAREAGVQCQLGALVGESRLLAAAADAALALGDPVWVEAAAAGLLLKADPFAPARAARARLAPWRCTAQPQDAVPGLGVEPRF